MDEPQLFLMRIWQERGRFQASLPGVNEQVWGRATTAFVLALALLVLTVGCGGSGPDAAPEPVSATVGEPVSAAVGAAGGSLAFTASGVQGTLEFPAGALAADTVVTVTPLEAAEGEWARLRIGGLNALLETPATLTLTLPDAAVLDASAALVVASGDAQVPLPGVVEAAARRLSVPIHWLGDGPRAVPLAAGRNALPPLSPGELILLQRLAVRARVTAAELQYQLLVASNNFSAAFNLAQSIAALQLSSGLDGFGEDARPWLIRTKDSACAVLGTQIAVARGTAIANKDDFKRLIAPVLYWQAMVVKLGGEPCPDLDPAGAIDAKLSEALRWLQALTGGRPAPAQYPVIATPVRDGRGLMTEVTVLGTSTVARSIDTGLVGPALAPVRAGAWATAEGSTQDHYRPALAAFGRGTALDDDLQLAGTTLRVDSFADSAATQSVERAELGRNTTPQTAVKASTVAARQGGKVRVSGPIQVLHCPDPATETLVVEFEGQPVTSRASVGDKLLDGDLDYEIDALLRGAGIPADQATRHVLRVKRAASSCNGAFGTADAVVSEITLDFVTQLGRVATPGGSLRAMAPDAQGNLVVQGRNAAAFGWTGPAGEFLAKLDAAMKPVWIVPYPHSNRGVHGMGLDGAGNVYVGGSLDGSGGGDLFVTRLSGSNGSLVWDRVLGSTEYDYASAVAVDRDGNVFVVGGTFGAMPGSSRLGQYDSFVLKVDRDGALLWARNLGTDNSDGALSVAVDGAGNAYLLTEEYAGEKMVGTWSNTDSKETIYKLGPTGNVLWRSTIDSIYRESGGGIGVTGGGVVLAASIRHEIEDDSGTSRAGVVSLWRLSAEGGAGGLTGSNIGLGAMATDAAGHVCSLGLDARYSSPTYRPSGESLLICFDPAGNAMWSKTLADAEARRVIAIDSRGIVTIAGIASSGEEVPFYARYRLRDGSP